MPDTAVPVTAPPPPGVLPSAPAAPAAGPLQLATLDMARSVLMAAGTPLLAHGWFTGSQWQAVVGGALAIGSAAWSYAAAHPSKVSPLAAVRGLVKRGGQAGPWNADVATLEHVLSPIVEKAVDAQIKARAGLLAGPVDAIANHEIQAAGDAAAGRLKIS